MTDTPSTTMDDYRLDRVAEQVGQMSQDDARRLAEILSSMCGVHRDTAFGLLMVMAGWGWERTQERRKAAAPDHRLEKLAVMMVDGTAELATGDVKWGELSPLARRVWLDRARFARDFFGRTGNG